MLKIPAILICLLFVQVVQADTIEQMQDELESGQFARAATTGLALLRLQPDNVKLQFLTALAFQKNLQPRQAQRYYEKIISAHPELPEPRNNLAIIYQQQGEYDKAVKLLVESLNTNPVYATAWKNLSNIYQGLASEAYRKALSDEQKTDSVINKIQLTELDSLHFTSPEESGAPPLQQASVRAETEKPVAIAEPAEDKAEPTTTAVATIEAPVAAPALPDEQQMIQLIKDWADAWSNQDFDHYVAAYSGSYKGRYPNHQEWVKQRRKRVVSKIKIQVTLSNLVVKSRTADSVVIDFHQAYQSPSYSDKVAKRIQLQRIDNAWKIKREVTLAVL